MRLFVFIAALLFSAAPTPGFAQERPYEARLIGSGEGPLVSFPVYRAPEYDADTHLLVYVVSTTGMPEADLPFVFPPGGVVVPRGDIALFQAGVRAEGGRRLFVCTVRGDARATFDFARRSSRETHCVLSPE